MGSKYLYAAFCITLLIEILNLIFKFFNVYYFNLCTLAILTVLTAFLGHKIGIKIGWIATVAIVFLLLIILMTFVVWN